MAAITLKGLSKSFASGEKTHAAVSDLSLEIKDNQFVTLLGPSGCGKTTTLRLIAGYMPPDAGTIHVGERLLSAPANVVPPDQRRMGMVFQNYAVWPHMTVFENVAFGLKLRKTAEAEAARRVAETLTLVNLSGLEGRYPNELSGGQQQRVALARSLVVEPEILLLDEPLSNLDAKLRVALRSELKQLQRRTRITFVYVTHDQAEALALSDQIAVIDHGRLQQYGTPFEVYARPANRTVADFMGLVNLLPGKVADVRMGNATIETGGALRLEIAVSRDIGPGNEIDVAIRPENIRITRLLAPPKNGAPAKIAEHTYLGSASEYLARLDSGETLRVLTHPSQRFAVGDTVSVEIDANQCTIFRRAAPAPPPVMPNPKEPAE